MAAIRTDRDNIVREAAKRILASNQHDYILIDRSGSMGARWTDTIGGVNAYLSALARDPGTKDVKVTVAVFDGHGGLGSFTNVSFDILRRDLAACQTKLIDKYEAMPRGSTPLFDAVGRLVNLAKVDNPERSALVIITDGEENASREFTKESSRALLDSCRQRGWQVIFLGADFDNFSQAQSLGNQMGQTIMAQSANLAGTMTSTASMRSSYGATGQSMNYSDEDRTRAMKPSGGSGA